MSTLRWAGLYTATALALFLSFGWTARAVEITGRQAQTAVSNWTRRAPHPLDARIGQTVRDAKTYRSSAGEALFHVVRLAEGGFVVTSADDGIVPVIAFSEADDLVPGEQSTLWVMLNIDLPQRLKAAKERETLTSAQASAIVVGGSDSPQALWQALLANDRATTLGFSSISDLRVAPLVGSTWGQSTVGYAPEIDVYNYFTPNGCVCGCVATAGAQVMRYHTYPRTSVYTSTYTIMLDGVPRAATMMGGLYDWDNMPVTPSSSISLKQREAIGKLTSDVGVASKMMYTKKSSGAYPSDLSTAFVRDFKYASAKFCCVLNGQSISSTVFMNDAVLANLDAGFPVVLGISHPVYGSGKHAVVGDGYGYHGSTMYVHLNMGWDGYDDAWYALPSVDDHTYYYTVFEQLVFNIFPSHTGEIISGRVLDIYGNPMHDVSVTAVNVSSGTTLSIAVTNEKGIYSILIPKPAVSGASYRLTAQKEGQAVSRTVSGIKPTVSWSGSGNAGQVGNRWGVDLSFSDPFFCTVRFDPSGGSVSPESRRVTRGGPYATLPVPVRTGHTFGGWWTGENGTGSQVTESTIVVSECDHALYAKWTPAVYTVQFAAHNAPLPFGIPSSLPPKTVVFNAPYGALPAVTLDRCTFKGWWTEADGGGVCVQPSTLVAIPSNHVLHADWIGDAFKVTFKAEGGSVDIASKVVHYRDPYGALPTPARAGYFFRGWYFWEKDSGLVCTSHKVFVGESTLVKMTKDHNLCADWTGVSCTVTFDPEGGAVTPDTQVMAYGDLYGSLPKPTRDGFTFLGWWTGDNGTGTAISNNTRVVTTSAQTLYAKWQQATYTVTLDAEGGRVANPVGVICAGRAYGSVLDQVPVRDGYAFGGWWTERRGSGSRVYSSTPIVINANHTLYAKWPDTKYVVTLDPQGGLVNPASKVITYGAGARWEYGVLPTPVRAGHRFCGWWWTGVDGRTVRVTEDTAPVEVSNHTLSARWEADSADRYLVIDLANGQTAASYPVTYLSSAPAGGWTDAHKTSKLVLRRIDPNVFSQGSAAVPIRENGRNTDEVLHTVVLSNCYYIGVFEVSQRQWELVMGTRPSAFTNAGQYASHPVEKVSYFDVREGTNNLNDATSNWPANAAVHPASFIGRLRAKTGLAALDLPAEAQWESACRAGTTSAVNNGAGLADTTQDSNLSRLAWYGTNVTATVGSNQPNLWELYDMHGNVTEWCLDWYGNYPAGAVCEPKGVVSGSYRVARGGGVLSVAKQCRSASRAWYTPATRSGGCGFRMAMTTSDSVAFYTLTVSSGTGGGFYPAGSLVAITASASASKSQFSRWTVSPVGTALGAEFSSLDMATSLVMPATNVTLTASYSAVSVVTVTFDAEGGTVGTRTKEVVVGKAYGALPVPSRADRNFAGWWTGDNGTGAPVTEETVVTQKVAHLLYALWVTGPRTYYADASRPDDSGDGRSWSTAFKSLQAAINRAADGETVVAADGVYDVGIGDTSVGKSRIGITNNITVKSANGAQKTFIRGSGVESYDTDDAVRGVFMSAGRLVGFTIKDGAAENGGGIYMAATNAVALNCVIQGNHAVSGGGAHYATLINCTLMNNSASLYGGGASRSTLTNCIVSENESGYAGGGSSASSLVNCLVMNNISGTGGGGALEGVLFNCTVAGNLAKSYGGGGTYRAALTNCVVWGNNPNNYYSGKIAYSCSKPLPPGIGNTIADPLFSDAAFGDYRLRGDSPCVDRGTNLVECGAADLLGHARAVDGNGDAVVTVDMGAYEFVSGGILKVTLDAQGGGVSPVEKSVTLGGVYGALPVPVRKGYRFEGWHLASQPSAGVTETNLVVVPGNHVLQAHWFSEDSCAYLIIDLAGGANAASYPVSYQDAPPAEGWTDEYKTTKLVLRKIPAGSYRMGSPAEELGRFDDEVVRSVTLTKDTYMGVFEVTQRQWELVVGTRPSYATNLACYATRPVEMVSYSDVRGASTGSLWPMGASVDEASFMGRLRARTGLWNLDLPTEAQWECACRAGTTTALNSGRNLTSVDSCTNMNQVGRYWFNGGSACTPNADVSAGTARVGSYAPNAWGLYDMHGNVWEWCLDWYGARTGDAQTDPRGLSSGSFRVRRGGSWWEAAKQCRSAHILYWNDVQNNAIGFRVATVPSRVTFVAGPGSVSPATTDVKVGQAYGSLPVPTRAGYAFGGWCTSADGVGEKVRTTTLVTETGDHRLFASWIRNEAVQYMVIDLAEGTNAVRYAITYLDAVPATGWADDYKTSRLVLKRIPSGSFTMGSPTNEPGRGNDEDQHVVALSKEFYMGLFEVTQRQWELVVGDRPSFYGREDSYASRPVERVALASIRDSHTEMEWPGTMAMDTKTFMGALRSRTGDTLFDLPTETQWEYACRAGTETAFNTAADATKAVLSQAGRWQGNGGASADRNCSTDRGTAKVGSYLPNAWGLYDMHGNVWEYCFDWCTNESAYAEDPLGVYSYGSSGQHSARGGSFDSDWSACRSANRATRSVISGWTGGFRLACQRPQSACVVTFDAQGGTVEVSTMTVSSGSAYGALPYPVREGHVFGGWWTGSGGSGGEVTYRSVVEESADHTLYAKWIAEAKRTVTVVGGSGSGCYYAGAPVQIMAGTAPSGQTFLRWEAAPADAYLGDAFVATKAQTTLEVPASDLTLTALFLPPQSLSSIGDLQKIGRDSAYPLDGCYVLTADINAAETASWNGGAGMLPIGSSEAPFTGVLDGRGHVIYGLKIARPAQSEVGLFGYIDFAATVRDLSLTNCSVTGCDQVGGVAGVNCGVIERCHVAGAVTGNDYVGGVAGLNEARIENCSAAGSLVGGTYVGGLIGYNCCGEVFACRAAGDVKGLNDVGGLAGFNCNWLQACSAASAVIGLSTLDNNLEGAAYGGLTGGNDGVVSECFATGVVCAGAFGSGAGGLVGENGFGTVSNCYALGDAEACRNAGRIAGVNGVDGYEVGEIALCYAAGAARANCEVPPDPGLVGVGYGAENGCYWDYVAGAWAGDGGSPDASARATAQMRQQTTYAGWDFEAVWGIREGQDYPYLRVFSVCEVIFDNQGGEDVASATVTAGAPYGALPAPARLGYSFGGWWTSGDSGGERVTVATIAKPQSHVLYARWTAVQNQAPLVTTRSPSAAAAQVNEGVAATFSVTASDNTDPDAAARGMVSVDWYVDGEFKQETKTGAPGPIASTFTVKPDSSAVRGAAFKELRVEAVAQDRQGGVTEAAWTLRVNNVPAAQTIAFAAPASPVLGDADLALGAKTSSGLPVVYASSDASVAVVADGYLHLLRAGTVTITASQPGDFDYKAAAPVSQKLSVKARLSVDVPDGGGTVSGGGTYVPGTKVSLVAKPFSGYVFVRWEDGSQVAARTYVVPNENVMVSAWFAFSTDVQPVSVLDPGEQMTHVGVAFKLPVTVVSAGLPTVVVSGLPAGLKYDVASKAIIGVPTVAVSNKLVTITAKSLNATAVQTFPLTVLPLPVWAQGNFNGWFSDGTSEIGTLSADITALGRITGKMVLAGTNFTFTAASYAMMNSEGRLCFIAETKAGKTVIPLTFEVGQADDAMPLNLSVMRSYGSNEDTCSAVGLGYRHVWADADMKAVITNYAGYYTATLPGSEEFGSGYLAFTVDNAGLVKTAGKLADGTVVTLSGKLIVNEAGSLFTFLYASPAAYKCGSLFGCVEFAELEPGGPVIVRPFEDFPKLSWESRNPAATGEYGMGFIRELELCGGRYSALINLWDYYENGLLVDGVADLPALQTTIRITDFDPDSELEFPPKVSWTEPTEAKAAPVSPNGLVLTVTPLTGVGTGLAAPAVQTPVKYIDPETGEFMGYNYEELMNPAGLTITFTRATGIFKGTFNVYYDYVSARDNVTGVETWAHVLKKVSYEGALAPVREEGEAEGRGFFLWPEKSWYDTGRVDSNGEPIWQAFNFNWSFDFLLMRN